MEGWRRINSDTPVGSNLILYFPEQMRSWDTSGIRIESRIIIGYREQPIDEWYEAESGSLIEGLATYWMLLPDPPESPAIQSIDCDPGTGKIRLSGGVWPPTNFKLGERE